MVVCPKCGSSWHRIYDNERLEGLDDMAFYLLAKEVQCDNLDCSYVWSLSSKEILTHYFEENRSEENKKMLSGALNDLEADPDYSVLKDWLFGGLMVSFSLTALVYAFDPLMCFSVFCFSWIVWIWVIIIE